jgi:hypothetical protein
VFVFIVLTILAIVLVSTLLFAPKVFCNCFGRSRFGPKRPILRHTSPIFSSDAPHHTQKLARLTLNCLLLGLKTADLNSYSIFSNEPRLDHMCLQLGRQSGPAMIWPPKWIFCRRRTKKKAAT